jgi:hypothetical protein
MDGKALSLGTTLPFSSSSHQVWQESINCGFDTALVINVFSSYSSSIHDNVGWMVCLSQIVSKLVQIL